MKRYTFSDLQQMAKNGDTKIMFTGLCSSQDNVLSWNPECLPVKDAQFVFQDQTIDGGCQWYKYVRP